ncbi:phage recombination protein Bet [Leucobacter sp. VD1]|uniref:phage recombination protein Bet n=1 Tax=Leucobacter sp. VD1 TaxID=3080381 RepID=UPI0030183E0B
MGTELMEKLPQDANIQAWSASQYALMQQLGLVDRSNWKGKQPDAPLGVIEAFLMQCQRTQLDPAARQIYAAEMGGKWTVLISIDGFRLIADRTGLYRGKKPTEWCGDDGIWRDVWLSSEPPAAARVAVMREGFSEPLVAVATYAGYCPRDRKTGDLKPSGQWINNPSNQLAKCAEMLALRQAFPNELSGLYGTEEMQQAGTAKPVQRAPQPAPQAAPSPAAEEEPVEAEVVDDAPSFEPAAWVERVQQCLATEEATIAVDMLRTLYGEAKEAGLLRQVLVEDMTVDQVLRGAKAEILARGEA